jgi:flagellar hook-length control protein FliK
VAAPVVAQIQAATSLGATQAATGERLSARVGTAAWETQVSQKVIYMAAGGDQSAEMTLNPPDLGPLQVVLSVSNDQASVTFTSAQPEVRQALENAMPRLREMMGDSGIALGNATVNAGQPGQQQAGGEQRQAAGTGARYGAESGQADNAAEAAPVARTVQRLDRGLVDIFA